MKKIITKLRQISNERNERKREKPTLSMRWQKKHPKAAAYAAEMDHTALKYVAGILGILLISGLIFQVYLSLGKSGDITLRSDTERGIAQAGNMTGYGRMPRYAIDVGTGQKLTRIDVITKAYQSDELYGCSVDTHKGQSFNGVDTSDGRDNLYITLREPLKGYKDDMEMCQLTPVTTLTEGDAFKLETERRCFVNGVSTEPVGVLECYYMRLWDVYDHPRDHLVITLSLKDPAGNGVDISSTFLTLKDLTEQKDDAGDPMTPAQVIAATGYLDTFVGMGEKYASYYESIRSAAPVDFPLSVYNAFNYDPGTQTVTVNSTEKEALDAQILAFLEAAMAYRSEE